MTNLQAWLSAFRLRTLPLALSCIAMGSFLAASHHRFQWAVLILAIITTIFLQILSNLANDYGDSKHGADHAARQGPKRTVQAGLISAEHMKTAMTIFTMLSFISGLALLWVALGNNLTLFLTFLGLGIAAIIAAITYTAGSRPYGYAGLGDISVLVFFGWVGVMGCYFLHTKSFDWLLLLPATSCGVFATAVLNVNNIRDIESDKQAGKFSIPVRIGRKKAVLYHFTLLVIGLFCAMAYTILSFKSPFQWLFLISIPLLLRNAMAVKNHNSPQQLDPYLKQMALTTLLFVLSFGIGLLWV
jgi:1,4-dihydroxy-2-naphthoate octaprenyltransferase